MIKSHVILLTEIDEPDDAVSELREKLEEIELLKNTVGILTIYTDAVTSGVYKAVADAIPFPIAGITTAAQSSNGTIGMYMFSIMVLTSDDCNFACGQTDVIPEEVDAIPIIQDTYLSLKKQLDATPKLVLMFPALFNFHFPGEFVSAISEIDPRTAVFGGVANADRDTVAERGCYLALCNGDSFIDRVAMVLISGEINPEFFVVSLTDEAIVMPNVGEITKCERNLLVSVNDIVADEFFNKIGFIMGDSSNAGLLSSTFILNYERNNNDLVSRTPFMVTDTGAVVTGGYLFEGASLSVAVSTPDVVAQTAKTLAEKIKGANNAKTALLYSCIGRRISLMSDSMKELEVVKEIVPAEINYTIGYASGEICPMAVTDEKAFNHEHNQTLIACVF
ncbi:MAG: FIST C-terminal domain-containing protein [Oscillospiraceae bacterium]|nr:FIST C-terminal domain-containing protein [Oscillospiraceae bacterium]